MLLRLIALRDLEAFAALYDRYAKILYTLILRIVRDRASADDILQDTFWRIWQKAATFEGSGSAPAWICRIARNKSLDHLRRQSSHAQLVLADTASAETVEQLALRSLDQQAVRRAVAMLPAEQRRCLELAYFEGMSQREIAEQTTTPLGTVKTRMQMGLAKLARLLRREGYAEAAGGPAPLGPIVLNGSSSSGS
jgi:RNA polymerase sigma-70 factor, ECF subfamily